MAIAKKIKIILFSVWSTYTLPFKTSNKLIRKTKLVLKLKIVISFFRKFMIQFRSFFIFLYISCLITFTYGDKRPILQIIGHRNLNCAANEKHFHE